MVYIAIGIASMWGMQLATQYGMKSDLRDLLTTFNAYKVNQDGLNSSLQRQIDDNRRQANLAIVNDANTAKELAALQGYLEGMGIKVKGVKK